MGKIMNKYYEVMNSIYTNHGSPLKTRESLDFKDMNIFIGKGVRIEPNAVIYENCSIGDNCIIGTGAILKPETHIGNNSIFGALSLTEGNVKIGSFTTIHSQCHITWGMEIGDNVFVGPLFYSANTPKISLGKFGYPNSTDDPRLPPKIKNGARLGENVGLAPGVVVGENTLIDMACLVTKDVPDNTQLRAGKEIVGRVIHENRI